MEISDKKYDFNILSLVFFNFKTFRLKGNTFQHSIFVTVYNYVFIIFSVLYESNKNYKDWVFGLKNLNLTPFHIEGEKCLKCEKICCSSMLFYNIFNSYQIRWKNILRSLFLTLKPRTSKPYFCRGVFVIPVQKYSFVFHFHKNWIESKILTQFKM